jgi:hypothetical protein
MPACRSSFRQTILQPLQSISLVDPTPFIIPINEIRRGESDTSRRRYIQDRLSQRAFRDRHRTGSATNDHDHRTDNALSTIPEEKPTTEDVDGNGHGRPLSFDERVSGCGDVGQMQ